MSAPLAPCGECGEVPGSAEWFGCPECDPEHQAVLYIDSLCDMGTMEDLAGYLGRLADELTARVADGWVIEDHDHHDDGGTVYFLARCWCCQNHKGELHAGGTP